MKSFYLNFLNMTFQLNTFSLFCSVLFPITMSFVFPHILEITKQMHNRNLLRSQMKPVIMLNTKQWHIIEVRHQTITQSPILLLS